MSSDDKEAALSRVRSNNTPYYKTVDINPAVGGLKQGSRPPMVKKDARPLSSNSLSGERVKVPKFTPTTNQPQNSGRRMLNPTHSQVSFGTVENEESPQTRHISQVATSIVNSGNSKEHHWYDDNEYVDIERLQGHDPLADLEPRSREEIEAEMLAEEEAFERGVTERSIPGEMIDDSFSINQMQDGFYFVYIDNEFIYKSENMGEIINCVNDIIMNHNIPKANVTVLKKLKIDFGVKLV